MKNGDTKVLVVDDEAPIRRLIVGAVSSLASQVLEAANVDEAVRQLEVHSPDLILLDVGLPTQSGYEFCKRLRSQPATAAIPVIMVTGLVGPDEHLRALEAGATDFIAKPFRAHELFVRARNLISLYWTQRRLQRLQLEAESRKTREQRERFERYLAPTIVSRILDDQGGDARSPLHDTFRCEAVVMFADLRGYTALAETLAPTTVVSMLNGFFEILVGIAHRHEGTTISMAGDCLMIAFGVPYEQPEPTSKAILAALESRDSFADEVARWHESHGVNVGIGIGISQGEVVAGNVGSPEYMNFTLIGDVVNVAARLTARARAGEILMTPNVGQHAIPFCERVIVLPEVQLKGKAGPVTVWCVPARKRYPVA